MRSRDIFLQLQRRNRPHYIFQQIFCINFLTFFPISIDPEARQQFSRWIFRCLHYLGLHVVHGHLHADLTRAVIFISQCRWLGAPVGNRSLTFNIGFAKRLRYVNQHWKLSSVSSNLYFFYGSCVLSRYCYLYFIFDITKTCCSL